MAIDVQNFRSVFESEDFHSPSSQHPSQGRKYLMLFLFCFAEFMDSFIGSALYPAINVLETDLKVGPAEVTWSFAAYSATFAAFLLISGRVSDVYSAKWTFIAGAILIGAFSLGAGFVHDKVIFFVLRALAGVGAAMTVPSALSLIVQWFPGGDEQARGIALFGGSGALGNVLGVIIGGAFVQWANWRWILWFIAIVGFLIAAISAVTVPPSPNRRVQPSLKRLDPGGVTMITAALVLFVYAATSGSTKGWGNPGVLAPLVVSVVMGLLFFVYEAAIDPSVAALPPYVWGYKNVPILIGLALLPLFWWAALFFQLMPLMQETYHWSPIMTSVHFLPTGICSMAIANFVPTLVRVASPKWAVMIGLGMELAASVLLPFADTPQRYYSFLIPAMIIGTIGTTIVFSGSNIALFMNTPPEMAGVVGGMFNSALQLGLAIGLAVVASITTSVNHSQHSPSSSPSSYYAGIAAGYWFVLGTVGLMTILVLVFYKPE
ncbi:MFS general substrate transporter, partial [Clavulina sp. PMI_390]